jgi:hypothetical protein
MCNWHAISANGSDKSTFAIGGIYRRNGRNNGRVMASSGGARELLGLIQLNTACTTSAAITT